MTLAEFKTRYAAYFGKVSDATVQAHLDDAEEELDTTVWGDKYDRGHGLLTAAALWDLMAGHTPGGAGANPFREPYQRLARIVGTAYRVVPHEDEDA